jgi:hypothetical protein
MSETIEDPHVDPADPVEVPNTSEPKIREPTPYEVKLRKEAKVYRLRAAEAERVRDEAVAKANAEAAAARAEADRMAAEKISAAESRAQHRIIMAEVRAHAIKAGMVDLDGLKLLDVTSLKLNEAGDLEGAEALIEATKKAKPWLFGQVTTSHPAALPAPRPTEKKLAKDMTDAEFDAAMKSRAWRT